MTPTWVVLVVGLGSGVIGSVVTAVVQTSHERAAELRGNMLNAADAFATAVLEALAAARNTAGEVTKPRPDALIDPATGWFQSDTQPTWTLRTAPWMPR